MKKTKTSDTTRRYAKFPATIPCSRGTVNFTQCGADGSAPHYTTYIFYPFMEIAPFFYRGAKQIFKPL